MAEQQQKTLIERLHRGSRRFFTVHDHGAPLPNPGPTGGWRDGGVTGRLLVACPISLCAFNPSCVSVLSYYRITAFQRLFFQLFASLPAIHSLERKCAAPITCFNVHRPSLQFQTWGLASTDSSRWASAPSAQMTGMLGLASTGRVHLPAGAVQGQGQVRMSWLDRTSAVLASQRARTSLPGAAPTLRVWHKEQLPLSGMLEGGRMRACGPAGRKLGNATWVRMGPQSRDVARHLRPKPVCPRPLTCAGLMLSYFVSRYHAGACSALLWPGRPQLGGDARCAGGGGASVASSDQSRARRWRLGGFTAPGMAQLCFSLHLTPLRTRMYCSRALWRAAMWQEPLAPRSAPETQRAYRPCPLSSNRASLHARPLRCS